MCRQDAQGGRAVSGREHAVAGALEHGAQLPFAGLILDGDEHCSG